jgi:hypothetical protein
MHFSKLPLHSFTDRMLSLSEYLEFLSPQTAAATWQSPLQLYYNIHVVPQLEDIY